MVKGCLGRKWLHLCFAGLKTTVGFALRDNETTSGTVAGSTELWIDGSFA